MADGKKRISIPSPAREQESERESKSKWKVFPHDDAAKEFCRIQPYASVRHWHCEKQRRKGLLNCIFSRQFKVVSSGWQEAGTAGAVS